MNWLDLVLWIVGGVLLGALLMLFVSIANDFRRFARLARKDRERSLGIGICRV